MSHSRTPRLWCNTMKERWARVAHVYLGCNGPLLFLCDKWDRIRWAVAGVPGWPGLVWWADICSSRVYIYGVPPTAPVEFCWGRGLCEIEHYCNPCSISIGGALYKYGTLWGAHVFREACPSDQQFTCKFQWLWLKESSTHRVHRGLFLCKIVQGLQQCKITYVSALMVDTMSMISKTKKCGLLKPKDTPLCVSPSILNLHS